MPFPFLPLIFGGLSALGGAFGNKNRQTSESTSSGSDTSRTQGTSTTNQTSIGGFNPEFAGSANRALEGIFSRFGPSALDPAQLDRQELVEKNRVNMAAGNVFNSAMGDQFSKGLAYSPGSSGLARGLSEMFRGSGLLGVAGDFAKRRFELPMLNEQLASSQRSSLMNLFNILPRSTTTTGTNTQDVTTTGNFNRTGTQQTVGRQGNPVINGIAGGITGFGTTGGFGEDGLNIPSLNGIFNPRGAQTNAFGLPSQNIPRTPNYNPDVSSVFPEIPNPFMRS